VRHSQKDHEGTRDMDHFTSVDTIDASSYFRSVIQPNNSFALHWIMPVTGFENNGQPVMPSGFDKDYGLYLTIDASGNIGTSSTSGDYTSLNVTLWADPKDNGGTPSANETDGATFSNGTANDIVLATGTMVSASMMIDAATGTRSAIYQESLTPTLEGTKLLGGSITPGTQLEEQLTTPATAFQAILQPDGGTIDIVNDGSVTVTLDPQGTILLSDLPSTALHTGEMHRFIHGNGGHVECR
jgi:hypothetical protein